MRLGQIKEYVKVNKRYLLPVGAIVLLASICLGYFLTTVDPAFNDINKLTNQLADTRKASLNSQKSADQDPVKLNQRLVTDKAKLDTTLQPFMSESTASQITKVLYGYAQAAGVSITELTVSQPQKQPDAYRITNYQVKAQGNSRSLVDFVSKIKEASSKSFMLTNLSLTGTEDKATLTLEFSLYAYPDALRQAQR